MGELWLHIIGNITKREELNKIIKSNSLLHSYLFFGEEGIGKKLIAKEFAKKILCETHEEECNCKSCNCFETHNHPDFQIINEQGENITISQNTLFFICISYFDYYFLT